MFETQAGTFLGLAYSCDIRACSRECCFPFQPSEYESTAILWCNEGFISSHSDPILTCLATGQWSSHGYHCRSKSVITWKYESIVVLQCDDGLITSHSLPILNCLATGYWSCHDYNCRNGQPSWGEILSLHITYPLFRESTSFTAHCDNIHGKSFCIVGILFREVLLDFSCNYEGFAISFVSLEK